MRAVLKYLPLPPNPQGTQGPESAPVKDCHSLLGVHFGLPFLLPFFVRKSVTFWIDFGPHFGSKSDPKIGPKCAKIDVGMSPRFKLHFVWFVDWILVDFWPTEPSKTMISFKQNGHLRIIDVLAIETDFDQLLVNFGCLFGSKNHQNCVKSRL